MWDKPLFSLQLHIKILVELFINSTRIFHPSSSTTRVVVEREVLVTNS